MLDAKKIKEELTKKQIIELVEFLGAKNYIDKGDYLIFPTICHNMRSEDASMKLYYYQNKHLFVCYTECNESFDVYGLITKVKNLNNETLSYGNSFFGAFNFLLNFFKIENSFEVQQKKSYTIVRDKYKKKNYDILLNEYDNCVLDVFRDYYTTEWLLEGISKEAMKKFNIKYYDIKNQIIIPHYDIYNRLIGIRVRNLEENRYGKYMPAMVENKTYSHPLSFSLYGLNLNKENIKEVKTAIIYEGEKSCLKSEDILGKNYSVACCGNKINIYQINILIKECQVREIILAFDKEYEKFGTKEAEDYFNKLYKICSKYKNYCNFSFIFDMGNLLDQKDSPVDKGKNIFYKLLEKRIVVKG